MRSEAFREIPGIRIGDTESFASWDETFRYQERGLKGAAYVVAGAWLILHAADMTEARRWLAEFSARVIGALLAEQMKSGWSCRYLDMDEFAHWAAERVIIH